MWPRWDVKEWQIGAHRGQTTTKRETGGAGSGAPGGGALKLSDE